MCFSHVPKTLHPDSFDAHEKLSSSFDSTISHTHTLTEAGRQAGRQAGRHQKINQSLNLSIRREGGRKMCTNTTVSWLSPTSFFSSPTFI
jgi:hypothetical protein